MKRSEPPSRVVEVLLRLGVYLMSAAIASRAFTADVNGFFEVARQLNWSHLPYRDFFWEYPPLTIMALLPGLLSGDNRAVYVGLFATLMIGLEYASLALVRSLRPRESSSMTWFWTFTIVPMGSFAYFLLDFISVWFATVALVRLIQAQRAGIWVACGFAAKIWPIAEVLPLVALRRYRDAIVALGCCSALVVAWYAAAPQAFARFIEYRKGTGFEIESLPGSLLLLSGRRASFQFGAAVVSDAGYEWVQAGLLWVLLATFAGTFVWMLRRRVNPIAILGALTLSLILTSRIVSPQYLTWLAPFVVLLWPDAKRQGYLFALASLLTLIGLTTYEGLTQGQLIPVIIINSRNALLVLLSIELFRLSRAIPTSSYAARGDRLDPLARAVSSTNAAT
jgi:hypothetical protein